MVIEVKKPFIVDKEIADDFHVSKLNPYIEYTNLVVIVSWCEDNIYKYRQFEGGDRFEDSYKFYVRLVNQSVTIDTII